MRHDSNHEAAGGELQKRRRFEIMAEESDGT